MAQTTHSDPNWKMLALGAAFLLPPGWIVFDGLRTYAELPGPIALFSVAGLAIISIALIYLGLQNVQAGDHKDARVQFIVAGLIMLAEVVGQWWFAIAENHQLVTALFLGGLSLGGAALIEGELMRHWRSSARANGQMSLPRAQVPSEVRKEFPEVAQIAKRLAIRYPNATQASVLNKAFAEWEILEATRAKAEQEVQVRVSVDSLIGGQPAVSGQSETKAITSEAGKPDIIDLTDHSDEDDADDAPEDPRTVSALVKEGIGLHGADAKAVADYVTGRKPSAKADTVRKTIERQLKPRSA